MDKIEELRELRKSVETEKRIDAAVESFAAGAKLVKEIVAKVEKDQKRVFEIIDGIESVMQ
jgi:exonuclease VII small subunit